jgi:hypothetical protein
VILCGKGGFGEAFGETRPGFTSDVHLHGYHHRLMASVASASEPLRVAQRQRAGFRRPIIVVAGISLVSLVSGLAGALIVSTGAWGAALQRLGITMPVYFKSSGELTERGSHIRIIGDDGNFEFEHATTAPVARINSYVTGTTTRTPIAVGFPDGQDIVELLVRGTQSRKSDLQQWMEGNRVVAAIDAQGRLRLGRVTLSVAMRKSHVVLIATLPSGKREIIAR